LDDNTVTYTSPEYEPTGTVKIFDAVPRFGYTEKLPLQGEVKDYVLGIMFIPGCICSITIVWLAMLAILMCNCRTSFLSGRKIYYGEGIIIRITFLLSAFTVLISSILFLTLGSDSFSDAFDDFTGSKHDLFKVISEVIDVLRSIIHIIVFRLTPGDIMLQENIELRVCDYLPEEATSLLDSISSAIASSDYTDQVNQLEDFDESLGRALNKTQADIDDFFEQVEEVVGYLKYVGLPFIVTSSILGLGAVLSWIGLLKSRVYSSFQSYFILPIFVCLEIIAGVIISLLGIVLVVFSDFCTGGEDQSPEGSLKEMLDANLQDEGARKPIDYYMINGCRTPNPFGGLVETTDAIEDITEEISEVISEFSKFLEGQCKEESKDLNRLLAQANNDLTDLNYELQKGMDATECENINPLFIDAIHGGTCGSLPNALAWMFWCFFATWVGGLFMLTTRAALPPNRKRNNKK